MVVALAACGGGGDNNGAGAGNPPAPAPVPAPTPAPAPTPSPLPVPAPVPTPIASTAGYAVGTVSFQDADRFAELNRQGQLGYSLLRKLQINSRGVMVDAFVLEKDSSQADARYQYRGGPRTLAEMTLSVVNEQGAAGFAYKGVSRYVVANPADQFGWIFAKDLSKNETYVYETRPSGSPIAKAALVDQLNAQGARGFRYLGIYGFGASPGARMYGKLAGSSVTYAYTVENGDFVDIADMSQRLNAQGARGMLYKGLFAVDDLQTFVQVYEKSSAQVGPVEYRVEPTRETPPSLFNPTGFVFTDAAQANDLGALGYFYLPKASNSKTFGKVFAKNADKTGSALVLPDD